MVKETYEVVIPKTVITVKAENEKDALKEAKFVVRKVLTKLMTTENWKLRKVQ